MGIDGEEVGIIDGEERKKSNIDSHLNLVKRRGASLLIAAAAAKRPRAKRNSPFCNWKWWYEEEAMLEGVIVNFV